MRFGSVCSGIEAASVAWGPLGWEAAWLSEIEPFPCAVLAHHYPSTPNLGDMTKLPAMIEGGKVEAPDVFCGGTPCQAFSVAGLRKSLDDARGNLSLVFCEIANAIDSVRLQRGEQPAIIFWENVPGVLNTKDNAFGCFLAGLAGEVEPLESPRGKWTNAGYVLGPKRAVAWRVLDAQYFGVAQRRRRVFVVASARDGFDPAAVLFELDGVRRDFAPSREAQEELAGTIAKCSFVGGAGGRPEGAAGNHFLPVSSTGNISHCLNAGGMGRLDYETETETMIVHGTQDPCVSADTAFALGRNNGQESAVCLPFDTTQITSVANRSNPKPGDPCHPLASGAHAPSVAYTTKLHNTGSNNAGKIFEERTCCLDANSPPPALLTAMQVRRLTPVECERLQGFPDNYTMIPWRNKPAIDCPDGPRYKALGNSWAVPNVRWIGLRIDSAVNALNQSKRIAA